MRRGHAPDNGEPHGIPSPESAKRYCHSTLGVRVGESVYALTEAFDVLNGLVYRSDDYLKLSHRSSKLDGERCARHRE